MEHAAFAARLRIRTKVLPTVVLLCVALVLFAVNAASAQVQGPFFQVNVRGVPMSCVSFFGEPVAIFLDYRLADVGMATRHMNGAPVLVMNPNVTNRYSDLVTQWWFAHECAHHALPPPLNSEVNADCFAVRELRRVGLLFTPAQLGAFAWELANLPGTRMGHLPGRLRAQSIAHCGLT